MRSDGSSSRSSKSVSALLGALTFLFALRVAGQAIQRWAPQPWLPEFGAFQGSNLSYPLLLATQLLILAAMGFYALRPPRGPRAGRILLWLGGLYMAGSITRIVVGLTVPSAPAWFSTWIPALFHLVLAGYVLALAHAARRT